MMFEAAEELNAVGRFICFVIRAGNSFFEVFLKNAGETVEANFLAVEPYPSIFLLASAYRSDKFDNLHAESFQ